MRFRSHGAHSLCRIFHFFLPISNYMRILCYYYFGPQPFARFNIIKSMQSAYEYQYLSLNSNWFYSFQFNGKNWIKSISSIYPLRWMQNSIYILNNPLIISKCRFQHFLCQMPSKIANECRCQSTSKRYTLATFVSSLETNSIQKTKLNSTHFYYLPRVHCQELFQPFFQMGKNIKMLWYSNKRDIQ